MSNIPNVFLDTNIVIDYVVERGDFSVHAAKIFQLKEEGEINLLFSDLTIVNTAYFLRKHIEKPMMYSVLSRLRSVAKITSMGDDVLDKAIALQGRDFEDAMQYYSAIKHGADCIVTRNGRDFPLSTIPVLAPTEFLTQMGVKA